MSNLNSVSCKKRVDTRSNWIMFMFASKCRFKVFRKQSSINVCKEGFLELERFGFEFAKFGFAGTHVHLAVNVPEQYSVRTAKTMLKSWSSKRVFRDKQNFEKLYPERTFWSGYEHHQGFGADQAKALAYIESQASHHNVEIVQNVPAM